MKCTDAHPPSPLFHHFSILNWLDVLKICKLKGRRREEGGLDRSQVGPSETSVMWVQTRLNTSFWPSHERSRIEDRTFLCPWGEHSIASQDTTCSSQLSEGISTWQKLSAQAQNRMPNFHILQCILLSFHESIRTEWFRCTGTFLYMSAAYHVALTCKLSSLSHGTASSNLPFLHHRHPPCTIC